MAPLSARWRSISPMKNGFPSVPSHSVRASANVRLSGWPALVVVSSNAVTSASSRPGNRMWVMLCSRSRASSVSENGVGNDALFIAVRREHDEPPEISVARQVTDQEQGRLVGPVQIVEHEQDRRTHPQLRQERRDRLEQPEPLGIGVAPTRLGEARDTIAQFGHQPAELDDETTQPVLKLVGRERAEVACPTLRRTADTDAALPRRIDRTAPSRPARGPWRRTARQVATCRSPVHR